MHRLTIDHRSRPARVSAHPSFADAHRALLRYVISADYYLHLVDEAAAHTRYELLRLADVDSPAPARHPQLAGSAVIEALD